MFGLKTGKVTALSFEPRIRELIGEDEELQGYIFPMLEVRRQLVEQCKKLKKKRSSIM